MTKKGWKDEKLDVRMVTLLKDLVFSNEGYLPSQFLVEVVKIFHRGSCINEYGMLYLIIYFIRENLVLLTNCICIQMGSMSRKGKNSYDFASHHY